MIRFCSGSNIYRWYLIPTIELERVEKRAFYLCLTFLKWYAGIRVDLDNET